MLTSVSLLGAPVRPTPRVPNGGGVPGPFPNTSVSAVNVLAKGGTTFSLGVEVTGLDGNGPIAWSVSRYYRGDIALRLSPGNPTASLTNLGLGFIEFGDTRPGVAANQAWRPSPTFGVVIPTARQNGPINWNDGQGGFFPTVAVAWGSFGAGYGMSDGGYAPGQLDINLGRAGTHASSPEANFAFSATWFPFDQGWLGGDVDGPTAGGASAWTFESLQVPRVIPRKGNHAAGLSAGLIRWTEFPAGSSNYGGLAEVTLPGVNALEDGMLVNSPAAGGAPTVKAWAHDPDTDQSYDDVSVAVSTANGNFLIIAERKFAGEGEGTIGVL